MHEHEHRVAFLHIHPSEQAERERESQPEQVLHTHDYYTYRSETPTSHPFLVTFALHISLLIFLFISVLCCCCNFSSCFICTLCCSFLSLHSFYLSQFFVVIWFGVCVFLLLISRLFVAWALTRVWFFKCEKKRRVFPKKTEHTQFLSDQKEKKTHFGMLASCCCCCFAVTLIVCVFIRRCTYEKYLLKLSTRWMF